MSGELAFLIRGNMAIAASSQGGAVVRVDPRQSAALIAGLQPELRRCGRPIPGRLHVSSDDLGSDDDLAAWADRGIGYARSLPPKRLLRFWEAERETTTSRTTRTRPMRHERALSAHDGGA